MFLDKSTPTHESDSIIIKNVKPRAWSGQPYNFGLYKCGKLVITQTDVGVGSQAVFDITPKLFFGVVTNMAVGKAIGSLSCTQNHFEVDLCRYRNGLVVTLEQNRSSLEYNFRADHLEGFRIHAVI